MTDLADLRIPAALRPVATRIIELTDQVCADLLDEEYAGLARHVVTKLARKRPSQTGRAATWAGGVVWALGQVNFLLTGPLGCTLPRTAWRARSASASRRWARRASRYATR